MNKFIGAAVAAVVFFGTLVTSGPTRAQFTGGTQTDDGGPAASGPSSFEPSTDYVQNNGLAVRVLFIGRGSEGAATISAEFRNATEGPIWFALIGPMPNAVDSSGNTYSISQIAGIATCSNLDNNRVASCLSREDYLPSGAFTQLSQGAASIVNLTLSGATLPESGFLSLTMTAALAAGEAPAADKGRKLATVPISFPLIALENQ